MSLQHKLTVQPDSENRRSQSRGAFYADDLVSLLVAEHKLRVFDINTTGALVFSEKNDLSLNAKSLKDLVLQINGINVAEIESAHIRHRREHKDGLLIGLEFFSEAKSSKNNRRNHSRVDTLDEFRPTISVAHPFNFEDQVLFRVLDISKDGMTLSSSLRNKMIFKNMKFLSATFEMPNNGSQVIDFEIRHCSVDYTNDRLRIGARITRKNPDFDRTLASFLSQYRKNDLVERVDELKEAGFKVKNLKKIATYVYAQTPAHYMDLQMLRWQAYAKVGKIDSAKISPNEMIDDYDRRSRIILAYIGKSLVGAVRFTFSNNPDEKFEMEEVISLPKGFTRENSIEVSRLCVDPALKGTDIVHGLMERCTQLFLKSDRDFLITSCTTELLGFYQKIGYDYKGVKFVLPNLNNKEHYFISISADKGVKVKGMNPLYWLFTYGNAIDYLVKMKFIERNIFVQLKVKVIKFAAKIIMAIKNRYGSSR